MEDFNSVEDMNEEIRKIGKKRKSWSILGSWSNFCEEDDSFLFFSKNQTEGYIREAEKET